MSKSEVNFPSKEHIFLLPDEVLDSDNVKLVHLKNPRTEEKCLCLIDYNHTKLYEILSFNEKYRSWFVDENIISDGSLKIATVCNPTYFVLPYLLKAYQINKNVPLDHLLEDKDFPEMVLLCELIKDLSHIADRKGSADLNVWSFNEKLNLEWLKLKSENLATTLHKNKERVSQGFSIVLNSSNDNKDAYLELAHGVISEYLCEEISLMLRKYLKIPEPEKKEKENIHQNSASKRSKLTEVVSEMPSTVVKTPLNNKTKGTQSAKEKGLAKSAKGTMSITSFFAKKT